MRLSNRDRGCNDRTLVQERAGLEVKLKNDVFPIEFTLGLLTRCPLASAGAGGHLGDVNTSSVERDVYDVRRDDLSDQERLQAESGRANLEGLLKRRVKAYDVITLDEHNFAKMACPPFRDVSGENRGFVFERLCHNQVYEQV